MPADPGFIGFFAALCLLGSVLALIDIRHGIIPDWLNLAIAGLGLARMAVAGGLAAVVEAACQGAAIGLIFWLLRRLYFTLRKIQGLGLGDVKFLAAAGIWTGIAAIPLLLSRHRPAAGVDRSLHRRDLKQPGQQDHRCAVGGILTALTGSIRTSPFGCAAPGCGSVKTAAC
jgi:hypothetical protein